MKSQQLEKRRRKDNIMPRLETQDTARAQRKNIMVELGLSLNVLSFKPAGGNVVVFYFVFYISVERRITWELLAFGSRQHLQEQETACHDLRCPLLSSDFKS